MSIYCASRSSGSVFDHDVIQPRWVDRDGAGVVVRGSGVIGLDNARARVLGSESGADAAGGAQPSCDHARPAPSDRVVAEVVVAHIIPSRPNIKGLAGAQRVSIYCASRSSGSVFDHDVIQPRWVDRDRARVVVSGNGVIGVDRATASRLGSESGADAAGGTQPPCNHARPAPGDRVVAEVVVAHIISSRPNIKSLASAQRVSIYCASRSSGSVFDNDVIQPRRVDGDRARVVVRSGSVVGLDGTRARRHCREGGADAAGRRQLPRHYTGPAPGDRVVAEVVVAHIISSRPNIKSLASAQRVSIYCASRSSGSVFDNDVIQPRRVDGDRARVVVRSGSVVGLDGTRARCPCREGGADTAGRRQLPRHYTGPAPGDRVVAEVVVVLIIPRCPDVKGLAGVHRVSIYCASRSSSSVLDHDVIQPRWVDRQCSQAIHPIHRPGHRPRARHLAGIDVVRPAPSGPRLDVETGLTGSVPTVPVGVRRHDCVGDRFTRRDRL